MQARAIICNVPRVAHASGANSSIHLSSSFLQTSVIGLCELWSASSTPEVSGQVISAIKTSAAHLKHLVTNFLDAEKFSAQGIVSMVNGPCNLISSLRV